MVIYPAFEASGGKCNTVTDVFSTEQEVRSDTETVGNFQNCVTCPVFTFTDLVCFCAPLSAFKPTPAVVAPPATVKLEGLTKSSRMKVKWTQLGLVFFLVLSLVMTGCFFWQYQLPKALPGKETRRVTGDRQHHLLQAAFSPQILFYFSINHFRLS